VSREYASWLIWYSTQRNATNLKCCGIKICQVKKDRLTFAPKLCSTKLILQMADQRNMTISPAVEALLLSFAPD
jgi:hypothetical protein